MNYYEALGRRLEMQNMISDKKSILGALCNQVSRKATELTYSNQKRLSNIADIRPLLDQIEQFEKEIFEIETLMAELPIESKK
jgi:hypothetical protein